MIDGDEEGKINFWETVLMRVVGHKLPVGVTTVSRPPAS
jgi:hypothetical protein